MILGNDLVGLISHKFKEKDLDSYLLKLYLYPISLIFERHYDLNIYEFKIELLNKYNIGIHIKL